jgi:hypothetical protein
MSEQELRDYVKAWTHTFKEYGGRCHCGNDEYMAQITTIDTDVVAIRILRYTEEKVGLWRPRATEIVRDWTIANYKKAAEMLAWANSGGNWKGSEGL